jgi:hypothetical protein
MAQSGRRLTVRPVESEQPGAQINYFQKQQCMRKQPNKKVLKASIQPSGPINCRTYYHDFYFKMKNSIATREANPGRPAIPEINAVNILIGM